MQDDRTVPSRRTGWPVRTIRLEVVRGPDTGLRLDAAEDVVSIGTAEGNDVVLRDPKVSRFHVEVRRHGAHVVVTDRRSTNGTVIGPVRLRDAAVTLTEPAVLLLGDSAVRVADGDVVTVEVDADDRIGALRGATPSMRKLFGQIERVAAKDVSVLVLGESGTGKELVARAIHDASPRAHGPFETLDCGAIAPSLFASELFGHERGAFTGADRRHVGVLERAAGGTVFLDEIGELPADLQSALLGALERRRIRRVGGRDEVAIDVRVVSATHRDLRAEVNAGTFRLDLYYRLAVVLLEVPPLRERTQDIPLLVEHFVREAGFELPIEQVFPPETLRGMARHSWPGNVRELRNVVEAALAMGEPPRLEHAPHGPAHGGASDHGGDRIAGLLELPYREARGELLAEFERRYLEALLQRTGGNVRQAAREARMDRSYLIELLEKHDLK